MKPGILLASPEGRKLIRKKEILRALNEYDNLELSGKDQGYLNLAKIVLLTEQELETTAT
jgi:hypothetical protein|tara:strand:- start:226 stop:405 length:180 start_codon:yes stop_codon:yes gene_type:complete